MLSMLINRAPTNLRLNYAVLGCSNSKLIYVCRERFEGPKDLASFPKISGPQKLVTSSLDLKRPLTDKRFVNDNFSVAHRK
jgi:hypothetical protein